MHWWRTNGITASGVVSERPRIMREISELIVRMAFESPKWGYTRIYGALANLRYTVGRRTDLNSQRAGTVTTGADCVGAPSVSVNISIKKLSIFLDSRSRSSIQNH